MNRLTPLDGGHHAMLGDTAHALGVMPGAPAPLDAASLAGAHPPELAMPVITLPTHDLLLASMSTMQTQPTE